MKKETMVVELNRNTEGRLEATVDVTINLGKVFEPKEGVVHMPPNLSSYQQIIMESIIHTARNSEDREGIKQLIDSYAAMWFKSYIGLEVDGLALEDGKLVGFKDTIEPKVLSGNYVRSVLEITDDMIDDICCSALEGGINYWCRKAEVIGGDYKGADSASDAVSNGARILLHEIEDDHKDNEEEYTLTKEKVLAGIQLYIEKGATEANHIKLNLENMDANDADLIVQYGLFGKLVFS